MRNTAIYVENLGKQFSIGASRNRTFSFQRTLLDAIKDPFKRIVKGKGWHTSADSEPFWALKEVSFEVKSGEVVGIIGRNGSGKSTLLKILSRIVEPTTGKAIVNGRVGSLLEIGMGFHPELTGRENIYLSGAVLGMRRNEIESRFDAIVDFSGVEVFLDTPVKRYSSGMYVRLAFAVAAQMEPEVLIIDEVLAVGDQAFQKKCIQRMELLAQEGRTILFVSHSMESVRRLCDTAILLENGRLTKHGVSDDVVDTYLNLVDEDVEAGDLAENLGDICRIIARLPDDPTFRLNHLAIFQDGQATLNVKSDRPIKIKIDYEVLEKCPGLYVFFRLYSHSGSLVFESLHNGSEVDLPIVTPGDYVSVAEIPADFLAPKPYELWVGAAVHNVRSCLPHMIRIPLDVSQTGSAHRAYPNRRVKGEIAPLISWETELQGMDMICELEEAEPDPPSPVISWDTFDKAPGNMTIRMHCITIRNKEGSIVGTVDSGEPFDVEIEYWSMKAIRTPDITLLIQNESNECVAQSSNSTGNSKSHCILPMGLNKTTCSIDNDLFGPGRLHFTVMMSTDSRENPIRFENVATIDIIGTRSSAFDNVVEHTSSRIQPILPWRIEILNEAPVPERVWEDLPAAPGNAHFQLYAVRILDEQGVVREDIPASVAFSVELEYFNWDSSLDLVNALVFHQPNGESSILHANDKEHKWGGFPRPCSRHKLICHVPNGMPYKGRVSLSVLMWCDQVQLPLLVNEVISFEVYSQSPDEQPADQPVQWRYEQPGWPPVPEKIWDDPQNAPGNSFLSINAIRVRSSTGMISEAIPLGEEFHVEIDVRNLRHHTSCEMALSIVDMYNNCLIKTFNNSDTIWRGQDFSKGLYRCVCSVPTGLLAPGRYYMTVHIQDLESGDTIRALGSVGIDIYSGDMENAIPAYTTTHECPIQPPFAWFTEHIPENHLTHSVYD